MKKQVMLFCMISVLMITMCGSVTAAEKTWPIFKNATFSKIKEDIKISGYYHEGLVKVGKKVGEGKGLAVFGSPWTYDIYKYGFMDKKGNLVIDCIYDFAANFSNGVARVAIIKGKNGFIDKNGNFTWEYKFGSISSNPSALEVYSENENGNDYNFYCDYRYGILVDDRNDENGKTVVGAVDVYGNVVIPYKFDEIRNFYEEKAIAVKDGKNVVIDTKGKILFELPFDHFREQGSLIGSGLAGDFYYQPGFRSGMLIGYNKKEQMGVVNDKGKLVVPFGKYTNIGDFSEGMCAVGNKVGKERYDLKCGYIDKNGKEVVPLKYKYTYSFSDGLGKFDIGEKTGFINKQGKVVIQPRKYFEIGSYKEGLCPIATTVDCFGYMDKTGKIVIPKKFFWVDEMNYGYAYMGLGEDNKEGNLLEGIIDKTGKLVYTTEQDYGNGYLGEKVFKVNGGLIVLK